MIDINESIKKLNLLTRTENNLMANDVLKIKDLISKSEIDILKMNDMGRKSLKHIKECLEEHNLKLKTSYITKEVINYKNIYLRDWFAGLALQSIITERGCNYPATNSNFHLETRDFENLDDAELAYKYADAMMKARENRNE